MATRKLTATLSVQTTDGKAVVAIDVCRPVLGPRYSAVPDQPRQVLGAGVRRLVGLTGPTIGILHPHQVEFVPRVLYLDKLQFILADVRGGMDDAAGDKNVLAGEDVSETVRQLDSAPPAPRHIRIVFLRG